MLLRDIIVQSARRQADTTALIFRDQEISYRELETAVTRLAAGFADLGIRPGDRIALLLPNCPPFVYSYYAAAWIGAEVVPANPLLKPAELAYIWRDSGVSLVVTAGQLLPNVQAARADLPGLKSVVSITPHADLPDPAMAAGIPGLTTLAEVMRRGAQALASAPDGLPPTPNIDENRCAVVLYTSGTTGFPKGAMLSHRNLTRNVEMVREALEFDSSDRFVTVLPLFHSFAGTVCMNTALAAGAGSILLENFLPGKTLEVMERNRATIFAGVPAMYQALLAHMSDRDYSSHALRLIVSGGAPLPVSLLEAIEARFGVPVIEGDGPTECSPVTCVNPLRGKRKPGTVGLPVPGCEMAIFDDENRMLPDEEIGEIVVRGDHVMLGYLNLPEATDEVMAGGWYHTGDLGKRDAEGYFSILDRKKDMILVSGLNVYPREVEEVLFTHAAVADAAVVGMPEPVRGEEVTAVVVVRPGVSVTERELVSYCRERLANFKVPRKVLFRATLPRGGTGKVVKRLLKKELELGGESV